ncbi:hypothetical protein GCM10025863_25850 [Microbacterium suwonense]|uniref:Uncharacterized protein n=1 Tax=Microbacterium suwonense TaxID=683047 RepID=A0ABN6X5J9_9MICO|nr:hypothetical protein GCM10025863_25850 [Microbacterium suwonense]
MDTPAPADFAGVGFWPQVDRMLTDLGALTVSDRALGLLGSIFYLPAAGGVDARTALLEVVRIWVGDVLRVGVESGAVRDDLPTDLLAAAVFGMLRGLDEWALGAAPPGPRNVDAESAASAASAPGILLRAMLEPPARADLARDGTHRPTSPVPM